MLIVVSYAVGLLASCCGCCYGFISFQTITGSLLVGSIALALMKAPRPPHRTHLLLTPPLDLERKRLQDQQEQLGGIGRPPLGSPPPGEQSEEEIVYQIDEQGYLMDEIGNYLLDDTGQHVKLNEFQIQQLKENNVFCILFRMS